MGRFTFGVSTVGGPDTLEGPTTADVASTMVVAFTTTGVLSLGAGLSSTIAVTTSCIGGLSAVAALAGGLAIVIGGVSTLGAAMGIASSEALIFTGGGTLAADTDIGTSESLSFVGSGTLSSQANLSSVTVVLLSGDSSYLRDLPYFGPLTSEYTIRVTDTYGNVFGELENAVPGPIGLGVLGDIPSFSFDLPTMDPKGKLLNGYETQREVQVWRRTGQATSELIFWGPLVRTRAAMDKINYQCQGPLWYLSRLTVGPSLINDLANADFELGLTDWVDPFGIAAVGGAIVYSGTESANLTSTAAGLDQYLYQRFTIAAPGVEVGGTPIQLYIDAKFFIDPGTSYLGPAFKERGLYISRSNGSGLIQEVWQPIQNSVAAGEWVAIYAPEGLQATPPGTTETYEVRLYSPGGKIHWDDTHARRAGIRGSVGGDAGYRDVGPTIANLVQYAQDPTQDKPQHLNLTPPANTIGEVVSRLFYFYSQANIWKDCLLPLIQEGLCDIDVSWNAAGTTRHVNVYNKQGSDKPWLALVLGGNVTAFGRDTDGTQISGSVVVVGAQPQLPTIGTVIPECADVGYAVDVAANGGVTLSTVVSASLETTVNGMQSNAVTQLAALSSGAQTLTLTVVDPPGKPGFITGSLKVGDVVPVLIEYGSISINDTYRATSITLDPSKNALTVTLGLDVAGPAFLSPTARGQVAQLEKVISNVVRQVIYR